MPKSHLAQPLGTQVYSLSPRKVTKFLLIAIFLLVIGNILEREIVQWLSTIYDAPIISTYFDFDSESNFPTLYSALTLAFCSYLLALVYSAKKAQKSKYAQKWKSLSWIFAYLAIDEACSIHELLIPVFQNTINTRGIFYFGWVIPAFFLLIIFLWSFRKFIFHLPPKTKITFILAGCVYISGALGMELVGGYIADTFGFDTFAYGMASRIEELLEMLGILLFIRGLLFYIQSQFTELHLSLSFQSLNQRN